MAPGELVDDALSVEALRVAQDLTEDGYVPPGELVDFALSVEALRLDNAHKTLLQALGRSCPGQRSWTALCAFLESAHMARETWDSVPQRITAAECGQGKEDGGGKKEAACRSTLLERLKLRSPELPAALEADWPQIRAVAWAVSSARAS